MASYKSTCHFSFEAKDQAVGDRTGRVTSTRRTEATTEAAIPTTQTTIIIITITIAIIIQFASTKKFKPIL